jgi:hypothetical protein
MRKDLRTSTSRRQSGSRRTRRCTITSGQRIGSLGSPSFTTRWGRVVLIPRDREHGRTPLETANRDAYVPASAAPAFLNDATGGMFLCMGELNSPPLWCPSCGGREYTPVPGGSIGFSHVEVTCDACGTRYRFATNIGTEIGRTEQERRESGDTPG